MEPGLFALEMGKGRGGSSFKLHSQDQKIKALPPASLFSFEKRMQQRDIRKDLTNFLRTGWGWGEGSVVRGWVK